ncbi:carbohydrate esterase family 5 protein [Hebeloma cylindrosporum]|uniref:Cutinase n=1 Tax=Hebeloma cylindrosporum TaxID=76867 RepID=A0A0C2Z5U2_HEBCY|nr:carbohydrate esterase family 5 protein [Hebeloma cylindrosporum h7]
MHAKKFFALVLVAATTSAAPIDEGVQARQSCADVAVFFARGTTEPGTLGTIIGPGFQTALRGALGTRSLTFTGINYPATIAGFLAGGDAGGARTMANSVTSTASSCPNTKLVISGYSQGAQLVHLAAAQLSATVQNRVVAAVTFGDPNRDKALPGVLQGRRKTFCAAGDLICTGSAIVLPPHLSYGANAQEAASFVVARV